MTMTNSTHSNNDSELLSAYLDNQLDADERAYLVKRLEAEPSLRGELEELRATVALCKQVEPVIPPRSFTLDTAMIQQRQSFWQFWQHGWFRLSGGILAMALGVVVITVLYGRGSVQEKAALVAPAVQIAQEEPAKMVATEGSPASDDAPAPPAPQMPEASQELRPESPGAVAAVPTQMEEDEETSMTVGLVADERMASEAMTDTEYVDQLENTEWTRPSVAAKPYTPPAVLDEKEALEARPSFVVRHSPLPEATPFPMLVAGAPDDTKTEGAENDATSAPSKSASSADGVPLVWVIIPLVFLIVFASVWIYRRNRKI